MDKRTLSLMIIILVLIIAIGGTYFFIEYNKYKWNDNTIYPKNLLKSGAIELLKKGEYEEGLKICEQEKYYGELCYLAYLFSKIRELRESNITTFPRELCDKIPSKITVPFWEDEEKYIRDMLYVKKECLQHIS